MNKPGLAIVAVFWMVVLILLWATQHAPWLILACVAAIFVAAASFCVYYIGSSLFR